MGSWEDIFEVNGNEIIIKSPNFAIFSISSSECKLLDQQKLKGMNATNFKDFF